MLQEITKPQNASRIKKKIKINSFNGYQQQIRQIITVIARKIRILDSLYSEVSFALFN